MEVDNRVQTLEEEFKLIKGELKQTLAGVRDYLMESGLPDSEYSTIMAAMMGGGGGGGTQRVEMKGDLKMPAREQPQEEEVVEEVIEEEPADELVEEEPQEDEWVEEEEPAAELASPGEQTEDELYADEEPADEMIDEAPVEKDHMFADEAPVVKDDLFADEAGLAKDDLFANEAPVMKDDLYANESGLAEQPAGRGRYISDVSMSVPRIDLLANLIRWVANAKAKIGNEQLAIFLEVYGISGHLTPELKEVIMQLAETTEPQTTEATTADLWSRLILELHGILTGGDAPLHPIRPSWHDVGKEAQPSEPEIQAEKDMEKPNDKPFKLKLVVTDNDGADKEFFLDLSHQGEKAVSKDNTGW